MRGLWKTIVIMLGLHSNCLLFGGLAASPDVQQWGEDLQLLAEILDASLLKAVKSQNLKATRAALHLGANPNMKDSHMHDFTPLIWASLLGSYTIVQELLHHGASSNGVAKNGWTPLLAASAQGYNAIVLLLCGKSVDGKRRLSSFERADSSAVMAGGISSLMWAAKGGHADVVTALLNNGARCTHTDDAGHTLYYYINLNPNKMSAQLVLNAVQQYLRSAAR